jgi:hypothetical protein
VDLNAAEPYALPDLQAMAEAGLMAGRGEQAHRHALPIFAPRVLADDSLVMR